MKQFYILIATFAIVSCQNKPNLLVANLQIFGISRVAIDTLIISKYNSKDLNAFYKNYNYKTVWESDEKRKIILDELLNCDGNGLAPIDYKVVKLHDYEKNITFLHDTALANYDVLLTHSLQDYLKHLAIGKLNPKLIYTDWDLKTKTFNVNEIIIAKCESPDFKNIFQKVEPQQPAYQNLKKALKIIDALPYDYSKPMAIAAKKKISFKDNNPMIVPIKKRLMYWQYLPKKDTITTIYDLKTKAAIKIFQENHGLLADGVIGASTIRALNVFKSERREQIIANMERWRWYPDSFGKHYTFVNIPEYKLRVLKDSVQVDSFNVIVGTDKRKSPIFTTVLKQVVFNPTWTVPPTLIKEDLIPDATKSRSYFSKNRIKIFNYKHKQINPWQWKPEDANKYDYVQDAGKKNTLGNVKILFPNKFAVYLHDTNHKEGFSRNFRSLSSGCTRVENPLRLAKYILNDTVNYNYAKIDTIIKYRKTTPIKIKQEISHYQLYYTAWTKKNKLHFRDDIYNLDADLYCRLRH